MRKVEVVAHNLSWKKEFEQESRYLVKALGENLKALHHIGSTAIPGIYAKPIIDFLGEVETIAAVDFCNSTMENLGYEAMGEFGIAGRRYFRKDNAAEIRTHHIHIFEMGSAEIGRHLAFRDYMRTHPEEAQAYSNLKRKLAKIHPTDIEACMDGKHDFIQAMDRKAALWRIKI
ncbi:protein of unknown function UPF0157 [[Leptolyngbya] sp. PCC 7376]|uniref:GrpB family protein n=1 Tax=[Leptolyngbya] sp. PCC 7376 TaxID=111781 RepID=UPI00029F24A5|nr:GrpB family protein [[Leptolyngbya] sp. PCC 7376]AFY37303.1 protein of unknown function UPF0157 [[Leptolyngbya] sp. PCC 7376]